MNYMDDYLAYAWELTYRDGSIRKQYDAQGREDRNKPPDWMRNVKYAAFVPKKEMAHPFNQAYQWTYEDGDEVILFRRSFQGNSHPGMVLIGYYLGCRTVGSDGISKTAAVVISPPVTIAYATTEGLITGPRFQGCIEYVTDLEATTPLDRFISQIGQ